MTEPSVYELLGKQIENGFEQQDARSNQLLEQQRLTNGRVRDAEIQLALAKQRLDSHDERLKVWAERSHVMSGMVQQIPQLVLDVKEVDGKLSTLTARMPVMDVDEITKKIMGAIHKKPRAVYARETGLVITTVGLTVAALKFLGMVVSR